MKAALIYPHQLFSPSLALKNVERAYLVEEPLHFTQFKFHKQKLVLHRASMKSFAKHLEQNHKNVEVRYVEHHEMESTGDIAKRLKKDGIETAVVVDPVDDWLEKRLRSAIDKAGIDLEVVDSPMFLNSADEVNEYFVGRKSYSMAKFYQKEREKRNILMTSDGKPAGGKFSFDAENRKKLPKDVSIPELKRPQENEFVKEAREYVDKHFADNFGEADDFAYPVDHSSARQWLKRFLDERLEKFGDYEDAIESDESFVFHSVLTPMLNIGLLTPEEVIEAAIEFAEKNDTPINSLEGFVRQIVGWREFMRGVYVAIGRKQRTSNFWKHERKLPDSFWKGQTGIGPLDNVIKKALRNSYNHHIERLMIVGNFMVLTEIHPDDAYRWFMEMYIDAYDWVMVPNVYGMSLQTDGGLITTKPYISGSNYIRKMSDFGKGDWSEIWDGLYWRFISKHERFFSDNPRLSMMPRMLAKMDPDRRERLMNSAENFLKEM